MDEFAPTDSRWVVIEAEPLWGFVLVLLAGLLLLAMRRRVHRVGVRVAPATPVWLRFLARSAYAVTAMLLVSFGLLGAVLALVGPVRVG